MRHLPQLPVRTRLLSRWLGSSHAGIVIRWYSLRRLLRDFVSLTSPQHIVDAGCGNGLYVLELARLYPQHQFVGLDVDPTAIEDAKLMAERENLSNTRFYVHNLAQDSLPPETAHLVTCTNVGCCIEDVDAFSRGLAALVRPCGTLVVQDQFTSNVADCQDTSVPIVEYLKRLDWEIQTGRAFGAISNTAHKLFEHTRSVPSLRWPSVPIFHLAGWIDNLLWPPGGGAYWIVARRQADL